MTYRVRSAEDRRREIQEHAARLGINEAFVSNLVDSFYARVQAHPLLGPIFEKEIKDEWEPHLAKMKDFWSSVAMNTGRYSGKPFPAHMKLTGVTPAHFNIWLALFRLTLEDISENPETVDYFMERADRIAQNFQFGMFELQNQPAR
ncbi:MAG: group III truncated hemoglobin [Alphaproteobacteria bacterium]|nr:globin [Hyphomonas sp.]MBR9808714.1 group III truncated hemoglobin [Alphaproteobacteria bacterium]|tara:strand:- start:4539 stop:4979 length:441 start_codon:yes stop_codon:yes gene_type:complete